MQASSHYDGQDLEALAEMPRYTGWVLDQFRPLLCGDVIEVGAGIGNVSLGYAADSRSALLVEPADNLFVRLSDRVRPLPHVRTFHGVLDDVPDATLDASFDAALMVNVLEHIADDEATLRRLGQALRPGAHLLLFVPAMPWLYGTLDALVHHHRRYTRGGLRNLVTRCGFEVQRLDFFDVLGVLPWLIAGRVVRRDRFDDAGARLYDRFGVPLTAWFERGVDPPLGKSLVCIARRA